MEHSRIAEERKRLKLSQEELANKLNISQKSISKYEKGDRRPSYEVLVKMAELFNVTSDYLLGTSDSRNRVLAPKSQFEERDLSWRYPKVSNRIGTLLSDYRRNVSISEEDFAKSLDISKDTYICMELGIYEPSYELLKRISKITKMDIDYIIGASIHTTIPSKDNKNDIFLGNNHFNTRFEELFIENGINQENCEEKLGISRNDFFDIQYNRMPTLSELLKLSYAFNVSMDYIIGKTDVSIPTLTEDEEELLDYYNQLSKMNKRWILGQIVDLLRKQDEAAAKSVAADEEPLRKASGK